MKVYMDNCCYYRPFDNQSQDRIRIEADAILAILERCNAGKWSLLGSEVVEFELLRARDESKLKNATALYSSVAESLQVTSLVRQRANELQKKGLKPLDSLHVAVAEFGNVAVHLTTDDELIKKAQNAGITIKVCNHVN